MNLNVASEFSKAPGPRYTDEGDHSGQEFRENVLLPKVQAAIAAGETLTVDLDGTYGFGTSFLEEAFGGLIRINKFSRETLLSIFRFVSEEEPYIIDEIYADMKQASEEGAGNAG